MTELIGEALRKDPRIEQGKRLLLEGLSDYSSKLTEIKKPNPELVPQYLETLDAFEKARGGKLWFPYIGSGIGNGPFVELLDGSVKFDFISGIGPHFFGHSYPKLIEAGIDAALGNTAMQGHLQQNKEGLLLSQKLIEASGLDHCFLTTSGAMANENALKIAFQKKSPASRLLAFEKCFAGRTLALSDVSDKPSFREGLPKTLEVDYIPYYNEKDPEASLKRSIEALEKHIQAHPGKHAAMLLELVQGEGGIYPGAESFFKPLLHFLKKHGILVIFDEIQTFARTEALFAFQHFNLDEFADIVTVGKVSQVCATLYKNPVMPRPGLLSQTFTGSTASLYIANTILDLLKGGEWFGPKGKNAQIHYYFSKLLKEMEKKKPHLISGPYGIGSMVAFTPFQGDQKRVLPFVTALFHAGVITFTSGVSPMRVRMLVPAGAVTFHQIDQVVSIIDKVLDDVSLSAS